MDPLERADAILARARARGAFVVTPESATSPMDVSATLQIPRIVVSALDERDPDMTLVFPMPGPEDERPAITQEAATQSLASPARPQVPQQQPQRMEGLVPTVKQPQAPRQTLTQRLDG
ncbi:MAG: hypothetical protein M3548_11170 [Actinomycetota bacterium]|nr:hypothetical protein [Actinomycetota bacterium]